MKLSQALDYFLTVDRAEQTRIAYERFLRRFIASIGPDRPLDLIRPEDLDAYIWEMQQPHLLYDDHPTRPPKLGKLKPATLAKNIRLIKAFFTWCVKRKYLTISPASDLSGARPTPPLGQGKAATDDEVELLLAGVQFDKRNRALILLLAQSGCRACEASSLEISHLNLADCSAWVNGKGSKHRQIYFGPETAGALSAWLNERPAVDHDFVFTSTRGHGPLTPNSISATLRRLSQKVGLRRQLGSHSLRHRVGMTFSRNRVPIRVAQAYLGHADPVTTFSYYQDVEEQDLRAAGQLLSTTPPPANEAEQREVHKHTEMLKRFRRISG